MFSCVKVYKKSKTELGEYHESGKGASINADRYSEKLELNVDCVSFPKFLYQPLSYQKTVQCVT